MKPTPLESYGILPTRETVAGGDGEGADLKGGNRLKCAAKTLRSTRQSRAPDTSLSITRTDPSGPRGSDRLSCVVSRQHAAEVPRTIGRSRHPASSATTIPPSSLTGSFVVSAIRVIANLELRRGCSTGSHFMRGKHYPFFKEGIWRPTHSRDVAAPSGARQARPRLRNSRWSPQPQLTHGRHCPISTTTRLRACSCLAHSESGELIRCTLTGVPRFGRTLTPRSLTGSSAVSQGGCNGRAGDGHGRGRRRTSGETRLRWDAPSGRAGHRDPRTLPTGGGESLITPAPGLGTPQCATCANATPRGIRFLRGTPYPDQGIVFRGSGTSAQWTPTGRSPPPLSPSVPLRSRLNPVFKSRNGPLRVRLTHALG